MSAALALALRRLPRPAYKGRGYGLVHGDALALLALLPDACVDLLFADPPYFLSNGGTTCASGQRVAVAKGAWDESAGRDEDHAFNVAWLREAQRVLRPSGSLWVTATQHNVFSVGYAMDLLGFHRLNTITWYKPNASPNVSCRSLTHSTELVQWAAPYRGRKLAHTFHYHAVKRLAGDRQMRDLWTITPPGRSEKTHGRHPTQKPIALLELIMVASGSRGDLVVDPFNGSGTTGVVACARGLSYLGFDLHRPYLDLTARRLGHPDAPALRRSR